MEHESPRDTSQHAGTPRREIDPVCGNQVEASSQHRAEFAGREYAFCSESCRDRFEDMREAFATRAPASEANDAPVGGLPERSDVSIARVVFYGVVLRALVFAASTALYPWRHFRPILFETAIPVALAAVTAALATSYLSSLQSRFARHGVALGVTWPLVSVLLDVPFFTQVFHVPLVTYITDVAATYLMIPCITTALVHQAARKTARSGQPDADSLAPAPGEPSRTAT
jgi:YHS domain-containing protein